MTNLPVDATDADLAALFTPFGPVAVAQTWRAPDTTRPARDGYVVMDAAGEGEAADGVDGRVYRGRPLGVAVVGPWDGLVGDDD